MLNNEQNYDFRKRLLTVHKKDRRVLGLKPLKNEYEIKNGVKIVLQKSCGEIMLTAARDFSDYLFTSMNVSSMIVYNDYENCLNNAIILTKDIMLQSSYNINVENLILITGQNERCLAQALYYLEDKMNQRFAPFLEKGLVEKKIMFSPRMVHSGYGLDHFPNEHLSAIAHAGMDAILVYVKDVNMTPSGFLDFNELIYRAGKYGIDVYAYSNLVSRKHPDDADAQFFYDNLYGKLFCQCPGFKGIVLVGESVEFPSKDEHVSNKFYYENNIDGIPIEKPSAGWWPCNDYPQFLECLKKAIFKYKSDADIVFWTYNWGYVEEKERIRLIETLPTDISLLVTFEMFEKYKIGDAKEICADYTLSFAGPGKYFISEAEIAKKRGIRLYAMTNTAGLTWDMGTIPYEPMPYQWIERYKGIVEANKKWGLCGLMESHHYGFWPSFVSDLAKQAFLQDNNNVIKELRPIITAWFGDKNIDKIDEALALWSKAITYYTPTNEDQYGAFRIGSSFPFCFIEQMKPPSMKHARFGNDIVTSNYTADYLGRNSLTSVRVQYEEKSLQKMLKYMQMGCNILQSISDQDANDELMYLRNLGEYICTIVITGIHAKKWFQVISQLKIEKNPNNAEILINEAEKIIAYERKNAENAIACVLKDSRLGWEPSMEYMGDKQHIEWKLRQLDYVLNSELKQAKIMAELR